MANIKGKCEAELSLAAKLQVKIVFSSVNNLKLVYMIFKLALHIGIVIIKLAIVTMTNMYAGIQCSNMHMYMYVRACHLVLSQLEIQRYKISFMCYYITNMQWSAKHLFILVNGPTCMGIQVLG